MHILQLHSFDGPNRLGPQPAVLLEVAAEHDQRQQLVAALKDAGQSIGLVLGYLDVQAVPDGAGVRLRASFSTPTPALGAELARYVVAGLQAQATGDETWDGDELLWGLQRRRRAEALPLAGLQLLAEAASRAIPAFVLPDRRLQLGYGNRGYTLDLADASGPANAAPFAASSLSAAIPWNQLGSIPLLAVCGGRGRQAASQAIARLLTSQHQKTQPKRAESTQSESPSSMDSVDSVATTAAFAGFTYAENAGFATTRALLANPATQAALLDLDPAELVQRGAPFAHCSACVIVSLPDELYGCPDQDALAQALGVPLLLTDPAGLAVLNASVPAIAALAEYAICRVAWFDGAAATSEQALGELVANAFFGHG